MESNIQQLQPMSLGLLVIYFLIPALLMVVGFYLSMKKWIKQLGYFLAYFPGKVQALAPLRALHARMLQHGPLH